jgi:hypothetical protein
MTQLFGMLSGFARRPGSLLDLEISRNTKNHETKSIRFVASIF